MKIVKSNVSSETRETITNWLKHNVKHYIQLYYLIDTKEDEEVQDNEEDDKEEVAKEDEEVDKVEEDNDDVDKEEEDKDDNDKDDEDKDDDDLGRTSVMQERQSKQEGRPSQARASNARDLSVTDVLFKRRHKAMSFQKDESDKVTKLNDLFFIDSVGRYFDLTNADSLKNMYCKHFLYIDEAGIPRYKRHFFEPQPMEFLKSPDELGEGYPDEEVIVVDEQVEEEEDEIPRWMKEERLEETSQDEENLSLLAMVARFGRFDLLSEDSSEYETSSEGTY